MGRTKNKGKKNEAAESDTSKLVKPVGTNEETSGDEEAVPIPSQEHCTWLLNIIRLHAKEISLEQLKEFENNQVCNLRQQVQKLQKEVSEVMSSVEEIEYLKSENMKKQRRIERLEYENSKRQSEIRDLKLMLDELQQKDLGQSIQIVGLPETNDAKEDVKQLAKLTKDKLGIKIKQADIVDMHRLGKRKSDDKARNVVIKFREKQTRENIYAQRKKLIKNKNAAGSIYLNDSLTLHRQQLLYQARQLVKSRKLFAAWSQQGNILVKKSEHSKIIQISDNSDLLSIKLGDLEQEEAEDRNSRQLSSASRGSSIQSHLSDYQYYCDSD